MSTPTINFACFSREHRRDYEASLLCLAKCFAFLKASELREVCAIDHNTGPDPSIATKKNSQLNRPVRRLLPLQASFNGSGLILTYLVVLAIEAWPINLLNRQASMPPLACMVPVVCRRQCGCTGHVIFALLPGSRNHLVDGEPGEGLPALRGEDVGAPGFLLALQSLQPSGLVSFEVMGAIDACP